MNANLSNQIKIAKNQYLKDGFEILGVFGSFARSEETPESDLDILYRTSEKLEDEYPGWLIYSYIDQIRQDLEQQFSRKVDLVDIDSLNEVGKKFILNRVIYV